MLTLPRLAILWIVSCIGLIFIPKVAIEFVIKHSYLIITALLFMLCISIVLSSLSYLHNSKGYSLKTNELKIKNNWLVLKGLVFLRDSLLWLMMCFFLCYYTHTLLQRAQSISPTTISIKLNIIHIQRQLGFTTLIAEINKDGHKIRAYLNWQAEEQPQYGQTWQVKVKLKPLSGRINEGGFNRQKWLIAQHVIAIGRVTQAKLISTQQNFREKMLYRSLVQLEGMTARGLIIALAFGERAWIEPTQWQNFQKSGTSHLLAISGLHFGLVLLVIFYLVRACQYCLRTEMITYKFPIWVLLVAGAYYAYWADFSVPTQRAFFSILLFYLFKMSRLHFRQRDVIIMIMAILLLIDPLAVLSQSFWLSCSTIICLAIYYTVCPLSGIEILTKPIIEMKALPRSIFSLIHLQIGITLCLIPIMLFMFHGGNYLSLLINLFVVPLFMCLLLPVVMLLLTIDSIMMLLGF